VKPKTICLCVTVVAMCAVTEADAQSGLWKCEDPAKPFRFVTSDEKKSDPPPCGRWVEIRGANLSALLEEISDTPFRSANYFVSRAAEASGVEYPEVSGEGTPVTTTALYNRPERFGFAVTTPEAAPNGAIVVYDGLGGILVETREAGEEAWTKKVLYPSAAMEFKPHIADLTIPGKAEPRVLVPKIQ
jgi:hypothetical protein